MKIKFLCVLIGSFLVTSVFSQSDLNNYKYVIVPKKFDFLKEPNQYRLNELTQFLFNKYGFEAIIEGEEYPEDLLKNRCLGLKSNVLKDSGLFKTKLNVEMKDCNDRTVYTSQVGESREKEYDKAYTEALRNAFTSIDTLNYKYDSNKISLASETPNVKNDTSEEIKQLREEVQALREKKEQEINERVKKMKTDSIQGGLTGKRRLHVEALTEKHGILYAQAIENGYQLIDNTPSLVYKIKKTGIADVYLVENKNATLYKKEGKWILEYYENNELKQEVLNIKF